MEKSLNYCKNDCQLNPNTTSCNSNNTESVENNNDGTCKCNCKPDFEGEICNKPIGCPKVDHGINEGNMVKGCKITCNTNFSLIEKDGEFVCEPDKCDFTDFKDITNIKTISGLKHNNTCKIDSCELGYTPNNFKGVDKDGKSLNYCKNDCQLNPNTTSCNSNNTLSVENNNDGTCKCNCKPDFEGEICNKPIGCPKVDHGINEGNMVKGCKITCNTNFSLIEKDGEFV